MDNVFEEKRKNLLKTAIKLNIVGISICMLLASYFIYCAYMSTVYEDTELMLVFCAWTIPLLFIAMYNTFKVVRLTKEYRNYRYSYFYKKLYAYYPNYEYITDIISGEIKYGCVFASGDIYITKNWIINFTVKNTQILNIEEIEEVYAGFIPSRLNNHYRWAEYPYLVCVLKDDSRVVFPTGYGKEAIKTIRVSKGSKKSRRPIKE